MALLKYLLEKEFKQIRRDKFLPRIIFLLPVLQLLILPFAANFEMRNINLSIVDNDHSSLSQKLTDKVYVRHTGYPGGQRFATPKELLKRKPLAVVEEAVRGMLPKNRLGAQLFRNLYVYEGSEHPHQAQKPRKINLNEI